MAPSGFSFYNSENSFGPTFHWDVKEAIKYPTREDAEAAAFDIATREPTMIGNLRVRGTILGGKTKREQKK
jgi:hypothetical protein